MTKEKITTEEVGNAVKLAMLRFDDKETEWLRSYLATILRYMENLNELDTGEVTPASRAHYVETEHPAGMLHALPSTSHALLGKARLREDAAAEKTGSATDGAPETADGYFSVPRVVE